MGDHLDIMNRYTLIAEILKEESGYREFYENDFSKRNKKIVKKTVSEGTILTEIKRNKEIFLFLDTCTWLNHAENANYDAFVKIADLHLNHDAILLIPEQLKIEWDRHKVSKILKNKLNAFDDMLKKTKKFTDKMVSEEKDIKKLNELIRQAEIYKTEVVESINQQLIDLIDEMMDFGRTITTKNEFKVQAADLALEKHPPFHKNKNSVADAILFLSVLSYVEKETDAILYFVTDNKSDFSDVNNQSNMHPMLKQMAEDKGITLHYSLDLNTTLEEIFSEVTDTEYIKSYKEAYYQKYHVNFKNRCKKCQGRMVMDTHPWDGRGHRIFYKCERCPNVKETNEYNDYDN